jgi:hypothetical protein
MAQQDKVGFKTEQSKRSKIGDYVDDKSPAACPERLSLIQTSALAFLPE